MNGGIIFITCTLSFVIKSYIINLLKDQSVHLLKPQIMTTLTPQPCCHSRVLRNHFLTWDFPVCFQNWKKNKVFDQQWCWQNLFKVTSDMNPDDPGSCPADLPPHKVLYFFLIIFGLVALATGLWITLSQLFFSGPRTMALSCCLAGGLQKERERVFLIRWAFSSLRDSSDKSLGLTGTFLNNIWCVYWYSCTSFWEKSNFKNNI